MPAVTISFINQKGGCGKSSSCFHLAGAFAYSGLNVLLIDADPQGSLGQGFFGSAQIENLPTENTLAVLFDDEAMPPAAEELPVPTPIENISIVRANQLLARFNAPSPETTGLRQYVISSFLEDLERTNLFDIVLIDCPPNLYQCSWNALVAADFLVIPVPPEDFGTQGLRVVHQAIENASVLNPRLQLLGHLVSRYDKRLILHQSYEAKLRMIYGDTVLDTMIPEASAFKVALACRKPVTHYSPKSAAAQVLDTLATELLSRIQQKTGEKRVTA